ncbi:glycine betaine/proline transport system permease protein/glycine betaine/proline transport system substrate-binding protein [Virgibacillus subterraneus]|uniref:Glycine betaine/proline transport system permease protein/glycine betaine/proline transport system substrate-binding protein n=2 Tax=Virgibacillus TaxID=84406 RepID=A0A1H1ECL2_9BACI|nr:MULTISPECIES: ABC transporter permease subunit [Virgibacillus]SDQ86268.1 glycine betaine/proline transport system permease protein/glycine betaine/proline transport system substrate-binding protein [Virgibacillus salinus]SEQ41336.1 glycine betaine/proline transport system permease protein/glycine betaine/proline transport system substrate-binding protein [Virgibacillus subterraneus]
MLNNILEFVPKIKIAQATEWFTDLITDTFAFLFDPIKEHFGEFMEWSADTLILIPPVIIILVVAIIAFFISGKKLGLAAFSVVGLWLIYNQGFWEHLMNTFTLVLISSILSVIIGVPFGILMSKSKAAEAIITPVLDFMQTMPAFVYLIPAVAFFGIGMVPGIFASLIFATPPTVRFTNLGIRQVSKELVEASDAFGSTGAQKLFKVELPMAKATIMAGINQTVMLALSMVVIASMIGAPGLGREVLSALQRAQVGTGFVAGIGIVILAIIIDRFTQTVNSKSD